MTVLSLGEILWDVFPDREELGGAPFNLAFHASRLGHEALFISAVGDDRRGIRALQAATKLGIDTSFIQTNAEAPTGVVTVSSTTRGSHPSSLNARQRTIASHSQTGRSTHSPPPTPSGFVSVRFSSSRRETSPRCGGCSRRARARGGSTT